MRAAGCTQFEPTHFFSPPFFSFTLSSFHSSISLLMARHAHFSEAGKTTWEIMRLYNKILNTLKDDGNRRKNNFKKFKRSNSKRCVLQYCYKLMKIAVSKLLFFIQIWPWLSFFGGRSLFTKLYPYPPKFLVDRDTHSIFLASFHFLTFRRSLAFESNYVKIPLIMRVETAVVWSAHS